MSLGYGGYCGSNHTGRSPDQECWWGEGCFLGLSCSVKFPVDVSRSPYSVVVTSTVVNPGCLKLPFSLITSRGNVTVVNPGWVLYSSPYTARSATRKFSSRGKAAGHFRYSRREVFRGVVVEIMREVRDDVQLRF